MTDIEILNQLQEIILDLQIRFNWEIEGNLDIILSNRLRSANGRCSRRGKNFIVRMSKAVLDELGWKPFEETFRHEVAHIANYVIYNGKHHDLTFKKLCRDFGGTMNSSLAGHSFSDCSTNAFLTPKTRYVYTCPGCGKTRKMGRKMNSRKLRYYLCGRCRTPLSKWTETKCNSQTV